MKKYFTLHFSTWLLLFVTLPIAASANAVSEEFICDATQSSKNVLPTLASNCPIGQGLWGKKPSESKGLFWIQCGLLSEPLALAKAKAIYSEISTDVWMKPESKGYRCLIGPYDDFLIADKELSRVKSLAKYKQAFIRSVTEQKVAQNSPKAQKSATKAAPVQKAIPQTIPNPVVATDVTKSPSSMESGPRTYTSEPLVSTSEPAPTANRGVHIQREAKVNGKRYMIPYLLDGSEQFYMEYDIAWNRLSYNRATEVCNSEQMRLLTKDEWQTLIDSKVMSRKQWPLHLPYWGKDKHGLFTSGKITELTGTSLLNVVCIEQ